VVVKVFTIGFIKSSAEGFFGRLQRAGVKKVLDVRLNNVSQLAGFAKKDDLRYFLKAIAGIEYSHELLLAPTQELLDPYKRDGGAWADYAPRFLSLMVERKIEETIPRSALDGACLLCSEDKAVHCHRRLVVEYLQEKWGDLEVQHL
jgi:uncharacterized protein (DUF488 family)